MSKVSERKRAKGDTGWFTKDRFGMFIHWGLYALPSRHEWVKNKEKIADEAYQKYFDHFNPDLFDPKAWAKTAKNAGMKYFVITTKHHEGFCLWDSEYTDYKAPNTPYGKDLLAQVVAAFRTEGLKVGFYYSLIDWRHPEFPVDKLHPQRDDAAFREKNKGRDVRKYAQYMRDQVRELLTRFGKVDILWFDFSYPGPDGKGHEDWESEKMIAMIRGLCPNIILNNRLDLPDAGDILTPEQYVPADGLVDENGKPLVWEGCQTFSGAWGYHREEESWKTPKDVIGMLVDHVSKGGNLLLNVGPTARGEFDARAQFRLEAIGRWMKYNQRAIYGCGAAPAELPPPRDCRYTYNPETKRLYVSVFSWPFPYLHLPNLGGKVEYAQLLSDGGEIVVHNFVQVDSQGGAARTPKGAATLALPVKAPDCEIPVIEVFLKA